MSDNFYVYELAYPESLGGSVFYVGMGRGKRWLAHEVEAKRGVLSEKCDSIRSIWIHGEQVIKRKVAQNIGSGTARRLEQELIIHYGLKNLTNRRGQGRSVIIQVMVTEEIASWVKSQKVQHGDRTISDVVFNLLEESRQKAYMDAEII